MSLLWREELRVALCPERLILVRRSRGLRSKAADSRVVPVEPGPGPIWQGAAAALKAVIAEMVRERLDATVILSNHFVRYTLLPWSKNLGPESEWSAFAAHRFGSIYGAGAAQLAMRISSAPPGMPRLASALDPELIASIVDSFRSSSITLHSIQPFLMAAYNRLERNLPGQPLWLMLHEPGLVTLALIEGRNLRHVRPRRFDPAGGHSLASLLEREARLLALESCPSRVVSACIDEPAHLLDSGVAFRVEDWCIAERAGPEEGRSTATL